MAAALRIWQLLHDSVRHQLRQDLGRDKQSTEANCRFSVSQNNGKKGEVYGFDGGKKVKGRKRHIVVDSQGLLIGVLVTEANASERLGAVVVLHEATEELSKLQVVWVVRGYSRENFAWGPDSRFAENRFEPSVIERTSKTFERLPKRWIVERTFGWLNRFRRSRQRIMSCTQS